VTGVATTQHTSQKLRCRLVFLNGFMVVHSPAGGGQRLDSRGSGEQLAPYLLPSSQTPRPGTAVNAKKGI
jgi:hypothetical protein